MIPTWQHLAPAAFSCLIRRILLYFLFYFSFLPVTTLIPCDMYLTLPNAFYEAYVVGHCLYRKYVL